MQAAWYRRRAWRSLQPSELGSCPSMELASPACCLQVRPQDYLSKCRALLPAEEPESRAARMAVKPRHKRDAVSISCTPMSVLARQMGRVGIGEKGVRCVCELQLFGNVVAHSSQSQLTGLGSALVASRWAAVPEHSYVCQIPWDCWYAGRLARVVPGPQAWP